MEQGRRRVLAGTTTLLAGLAGCSTAPPPLEVARVWFPAGGGASGQFAVSAAIQNPRAQRVTATVYLYTTVGGDRYVRARDVTIPGGETATTTATYPLSYEHATAGDVGAHADVVVHDA